MLEWLQRLQKNFLLPRNLAAPVTAATRRKLESRRKQREAEVSEHHKTLEGLAIRVSEASLTLTVKAGEEGKMFGSVSAADIAKA